MQQVYFAKTRRAVICLFGYGCGAMGFRAVKIGFCDSVSIFLPYLFDFFILSDIFQYDLFFLIVIRRFSCRECESAHFFVFLCCSSC